MNIEIMKAMNRKNEKPPSAIGGKRMVPRFVG